ncbi:MAG: membrane dipeptidase [Deltaproteobacteria bacterium]|nr:membrane dipeptidase [Deltaproteobacteria bacterium]
MSIESTYWEASNRARKLIRENIVIDALMAAAWPISWSEAEQFHPYFDRAVETGITAIGFTTAYSYMKQTGLLQETLRTVKKIKERPDRYIIVRTVKDIKDAQTNGKLAIYFISQSCEPLDNDPDNIALYREMGFGYMLLAYNERTRIGDGCYTPENAGLTLYGKQVIDAMNRYGMPVDLSHVGERTSLDASDYSSQPVIYSHSNPNAVCPCNRNISDEQIKTCAATGGVVNTAWAGWIISPDFPNQVTPAHCVNAIDYIVQLVGIDHVGFGSDDAFITEPYVEFAKSVPEAYDDGGYTLESALKGAFCAGEPAKLLPAVVDGLIEKGYTDADIQKVIGGNMLRVLGQVWK